MTPSHGRRTEQRTWALIAASVALLMWGGAHDLAAQEIRGRVVDAVNGAPVGLAAVFVLDRDRSPVLADAADVEGYYTVALPSPGEYLVIVERLGYFENESPLLALESDGVYGVDFEMRPEPFRLDPLEVTVENEKLEDFLTLSFGQHPASMRGYRSIQGLRLEEAKLKAEDNTDLLRWLYIPVSHGGRVCVGSFGEPALPARSTMERTNNQSQSPNPDDQCGALYLDGYRCRNDHLESIDMNRIGVVVTFSGSVHMYTRDFDWTFRRTAAAADC